MATTIEPADCGLVDRLMSMRRTTAKQMPRTVAHRANEACGVPRCKRRIS
jgi:hypothetical protein